MGIQLFYGTFETSFLSFEQAQQTIQILIEGVKDLNGHIPFVIHRGAGPSTHPEKDQAIVERMNRVLQQLQPVFKHVDSAVWYLWSQLNSDIAQSVFYGVVDVEDHDLTAPNGQDLAALEAQEDEREPDDTHVSEYAYYFYHDGARLAFGHEANDAIHHAVVETAQEIESLYDTWMDLKEIFYIGRDANLRPDSEQPLTFIYPSSGLLSALEHDGTQYGWRQLPDRSIKDVRKEKLLAFLGLCGSIMGGIKKIRKRANRIVLSLPPKATETSTSATV